MIFCFTLSMPGVASWNGKWSGENKLYAKVINFGTRVRAREILDIGYFHYNFGDGWSAGIKVKEVDAGEAAKIRRKSSGFCGYDWMIDSIRNNLYIVTPRQKKEKQGER